MNEYFKKIILSFKPDKESLKKVGEELNKNLFKPTFDWALDKFKSIVTGALDDMKDMLEYSQLSNAHTRELAFGYGFSSSQAFGYDKALQAVGLSSMDDLMYANPQERQQFFEAFEKYSNKYDELYDSGFFEQMQEYQYEMEDFKFEMQMNIVEFFMQNKDTMIDMMEFAIDAAEVIISGFSWLINFLERGHHQSSSERAAAVSDVINSYSTSKSTNVSIDNTFNNVSSTDRSWLAHAGSLTYDQIIKALE